MLLTDLGGLGLTDRDEGSNAEAAREMLETGDWVSPTLNYEPRFAKLPDIMKAKRKPLETLSMADLGVEAKQHIQIDKVEAPAARQGGIKVASVDELIQKLKDEAKVI